MKPYIATSPAGVRVQVKWRNELLADSRAAIRLEEGSLAPVYYLPRKDVRMERLQRSAHRSYCPHKGEACYYSVTGGPENVAWSYEQPLPGVEQIQGHLAFYPDKVECLRS